MNGGFAAKNLGRIAAIVLLASATGACSAVPDWMDPFGDDSDTTTSDAAPPPDQTADSSTPDLAAIPDKPTTGSTPDSQKQVADSLAADRSQAKYSGDALRGDATTAAPPPAPAAAVDTNMPANADSTKPASDAATNPAPADTPSAPADTTTAAQPAPVATANTATQVGEAETPPPAAAAHAVASSALPPPSSTTTTTTTTTTAMAAPPSGRMPAVPSGSMGRGVPGAQSPVMTDAQLGFQRSSAPPLDASVSEFVPPAILNRYRQTSGGIAVASTGSRASVAPYAGASGAANAIVFFKGDTTILSAAGKMQVRAAAESFRSSGSMGHIRVIGHASAPSSRLTHERGQVLVFEKSQQRANSVAQELIRDGVPADRVLVEAVGDSQPVYGAAPRGDDSNRSAEIFLQS
jgi:outer membrane protein OmpA-like peptidoglycan-associated protein